MDAIGARGASLRVPTIGGVRPAPGRKRRRRDTTDLPAVNLVQLRRASALRVGTRFTLTHRTARLDCRMAGAAIVVNTRGGRNELPLQWVRCGFGGGRWYFVCPLCHCRVVSVYLDGMVAGCFACHDLRYPSQGEDWIGRSLLRESAIRHRLGPGGCGKPKKMHGKTYESLMRKAMREEENRYTAVGKYAEWLAVEDLPVSA